MYPYSLPILQYSYDVAEPVIDSLTMEIHYTKHHKTYVDKLNSVIESQKDLHNVDIIDILKNYKSLSDDIKEIVINNGGGHLNHSQYWELFAETLHHEPMGELKDAINLEFDGFKNFLEKFINVGMNRFGSGWVWLIMNNGKLDVISTANQDNPIMFNFTPIFGIDLWEHAYYLKYQNRRKDYLQNIMNILNWEVINMRFLLA